VALEPEVLGQVVEGHSTSGEQEGQVRGQAAQTCLMIHGKH